VALPDAPASPTPETATPSSAPRIPRAFSTPAAKSVPKEATPTLTNPEATETEALAIASLEPAKLTAIPAPPPSHDAGFSGAPQMRASTEEAITSNENASLVVPRLTAGGGVKDSLPTVAPSPDAVLRSRLRASISDPLSPSVPEPLGPAGAKAMRVSSSPDPRMEGRTVFTMAIQMPNVTSYSGSWMVWFAERIPEPGETQVTIRPPVPRRKVDPAYIRSAVDDRKEGTVRLAAVIGKDGQMSQIEILSGIDVRLDNSAVPALSKWLFEPALHNGKPIDVDAVFEVPFRLAPKPTR
jgi:TonB family protein